MDPKMDIVKKLVQQFMNKKMQLLLIELDICL